MKIVRNTMWQVKCIPILLCSILYLLHKVDGHKEEECVEVGFARASFMNVDQGYKAAKEALVAKWEEEDRTRVPKYANLGPQIKNVSRSALLLEETTKNVLGIIRKTRVGKRCREDWLLKGIEKHVTPLIQLDKEFAESLGLVMSFRCLIGSPYPNVDGTCINEEGPDMGAIGSKFLRLMPPVSAPDGFSIRSSVNAEKSLPSARKVAQVIRRHIVKPPVTSLFSEWSHFIERDTFSIPESPLVENVDCCENPEVPDCAPIFLDKDDPMYSKVKCFNYKRSIRAQAILGHRESLSVVSTYLDATPVYGSTNEEAFGLKAGFFGFLHSPESLDKEAGDTQKRDAKNCKFPESFDGCFGLAANDKAFLENLRLLLILEHNRVAESIGEINPHFDDALIYNEARRIVIAQYNYMLYGEFLDVLIGSELTTKHFLKPGSEGAGAKFIPEVNPGILTSFALASMRNPSMITEWHSDQGHTEILNASHFNSIKDNKYHDFLAMEIQRARDHGLQNYGVWRRFCDSGRNIGSWDDLATIFTTEIVADLKELYHDEINDVDIAVALLEKAEEGGTIGKTFGCIMVDQYARLRTGNRLYWEHDTAMLTAEQREAIKSHSSAAGLLCRHFGLEKVPKNPFAQISESNPEVACTEFPPSFDVTPWKDTSLIEVMKKKREEEEQKKKEEEDKKMEALEEALKRDEEERKKTKKAQTKDEEKEKEKVEKKESVKKEEKKEENVKKEEIKEEKVIKEEKKEEKVKKEEKKEEEVKKEEKKEEKVIKEDKKEEQQKDTKEKDLKNKEKKIEL